MIAVLSRACPDCSAVVGEPCHADPTRAGAFCIGRLVHFTATIERGVVYVYEPNRPSKHIVRRARGPSHCSSCGQRGHNARNPRCPERSGTP